MPRPADAAFCVADNASFAVDDARGDEGPDRKIRGGRIAAGIRDEAGFANAVTAEFGETICGFGEESRSGVVFLVPLLITFGSAQAEGSAEVDHHRARFEELRG